MLFAFDVQEARMPREHMDVRIGDVQDSRMPGEHKDVWIGPA